MALLRIWRSILSIREFSDEPGNHGLEDHTMSRLYILILAPALMLSAADFTADSTRGARLFETLVCVQCHRVNGKGGTVGPDLGRLADRDFTPSTLAATMWNHAPAMWASMKERDIRPVDLDEQAARDLFAYFYS